jgi:hypothetical protein
VEKQNERDNNKGKIRWKSNKMRRKISKSGKKNLEKYYKRSVW